MEASMSSLVRWRDSVDVVICRCAVIIMNIYFLFTINLIEYTFYLRKGHE